MAEPLRPLARRCRTALSLSLLLLAACHPRAQPEPLTPAAPAAPTRASAWMPSFTIARTTTTPAIRLTASDGTGLRLLAFKARAWVEAPLALTELHLRFENPSDRIIEGNFEIQLPARAAVSRFAMQIDGRWQEGEVIERQTARRVFEDFLHRRQDPALLEHDAGDRFRARVFPIPARGTKHLILTYSQELTDARTGYRLPLAGLPQLDTLDVQVLGPGDGAPTELLRIHETDLASPGDVVLRETEAPHADALRSDNLALARLTVPGDAAPPVTPRAVTILFDTSASQALDFAAKVTRLATLVEQLARTHGATLPIRVWCFDQDTSEIYRGPASHFSSTHTAALVRRRAFGASDLPRALHAVRPGVRAGEHVLVIGDGIDTAGTPETLAQASRQLREAGVARIDAILEGGNRDTANLTRLTRDPERATGILVDAALPPAELVDRLRRPTLTDLRVTVPGSRFTWPERLDGVQPGDTVLVYADLPAGQPLEVQLGHLESPRLTTRTVSRPLLERAFVGARISRLLATRDALAAGDEDMRRTMRDQIVALSTKHRVLSPFTGLLVLETEADYHRYGIRRDALADILAVGEHGPELLHRRGDSVLVTNAWGKLTTRASEPDTTGPTPALSSDDDGDNLVFDDRCPTAPETFNGFMDDDGCPDEIPMQLAKFTGTIRGIYFDVNRATIGPKSRPVLDRAIAVLREFTTISLEISGHCSRKEPADLCRRRATTVRDYFITHGIDAERLVVRDAGADEPVDTETTAAGRAKNRRIEFMILVDRTWSPDPNKPAPPPPAPPKPAEAPPYTGDFAEVMTALATDPRAALVLATKWHDREPGDMLALIAVGEALTAAGHPHEAARVFGSLIDLFPARADLRRHAAQRLAALGDAGLELAIDSYQKAVADRPDHPTGHRLLALALARADRHAEGFAAILAGLDAGQSRPRPGVDEVLRADASLLAAAYLVRAPDRRAEVTAELQRRNLSLPRDPSTRFVLTWESDANDVDLHVYDRAGNHASYQQRAMRSGGALVADVTSGYGPEMFILHGTPSAYPYTIEAHYFGQGPMGHGMGTLQIITLDAQHHLHIEERPFVIMNSGARLSLGQVTRPTP